MAEPNKVIIKRDCNFASHLVLVFTIPYEPGEIRNIYEIQYLDGKGDLKSFSGNYVRGKKEQLSVEARKQFINHIDYYIISLHKSKKLLIDLNVSDDAKKVLGDLYDALVAKINEYNSSIQ